MKSNICEGKLLLLIPLDSRCAGLVLSVRVGSLRRPRSHAAKKLRLIRCQHGARRFDTPQQAADVLIDAAEKFDVVELAQIFGPGGEDIVFSGEYAQDRQHAANFVAEAHEKKSVSVDPKNGNRAFLLVGNEDWPFPVPIVKRGE